VIQEVVVDRAVEDHDLNVIVFGGGASLCPNPG
jgi:hypothetical protein